MKKVSSSKTVDFPKFGWGIHAGETRDLPNGKEAQEVILAHPAISEADEKKPGKEEKVSSNKS